MGLIVQKYYANLIRLVKLAFKGKFGAVNEGFAYLASKYWI